MSDDNSRDRPASPLGTRGAGGGGSSKATQAGPGPGKSVKRGAAARTILGLPVMDPAQAQRIARAGISGRPPAGAPVQSSPPASLEKDLAESDTRYMDPPSEALGHAPTEVIPQSTQLSPTPVPVPQPLAADPGAGLFGSTLQRTHSPAARAAEPVSHPPAGAGLFSSSLSAMHDPEAPKPNAPRTNFANNQAPEAWRDDVRRMAERAQPQPPRPKVQPGPTASLRLKLDADAYEEQPYRAPKSALPSVLLWLVVLALAGGAAAYYVQGHGGVNAVVNRLRGVAPAPAASTPAVQNAQPAQPVQQDPASLPPAAAAQPAQQPSAAAADPVAQPSAAENQATGQPAQAPSAAGPGSSPAAADDSARQLADPEPPKAQPPAAAARAPSAPATPAPVKKAEGKPKAAPRVSARRHEPVVRVRPLDGSSSAPSSIDAPPAPADMPYVPVPEEPPSPDEPR